MPAVSSDEHTATPTYCFCTAQAPVTAAGAQGRKVVANLPYNLTKNILRRLLPLGDHISHLYLMLQVLKQLSGSHNMICR